MSECRALTNFVGNGVATLVIARWEGDLDVNQMQRDVNCFTGPSIVEAEREREDVLEKSRRLPAARIALATNNLLNGSRVFDAATRVSVTTGFGRRLLVQHAQVAHTRRDSRAERPRIVVVEDEARARSCR